MSQTYLAYHFKISPSIPGNEILIAELGEKPFESFEENENGVIAYIQGQFHEEGLIDDLNILESIEFEVSYHVESIEQVNWNEEWEKNFDPIDVEGVCHVRAPFHPKTAAQFNIIIEPKMSFGTGHHETTHMMIQHILDVEVANKSTLDMGCGTAILAILAEMKGAKPIDAIDIDQWCYLNSIENVERNACKNIQVFEGDASLLIEQKYDVIIANINRNILLNDMNSYVNCLNQNGLLFLSGFYSEDVTSIDECCSNLGLHLEKQLEKNNWVALRYRKI
ncbi:MAG: 50S ribosomal protein L11 methyltransferase [Flavobacterium sp.]